MDKSGASPVKIFTFKTSKTFLSLVWYYLNRNSTILTRTLFLKEQKSRTTFFSYKHETSWKVFAFLQKVIIFCVSFPVKHNLEMFNEVREIMHKIYMVKMHKIT